MRGLGDFQRSQMRNIDPRVHQLFGHVRQTVDLLEQLMLHPWPNPTPGPERQPRPDASARLNPPRHHHRPGVHREGSLRPNRAYPLKQASNIAPTNRLARGEGEPRGCVGDGSFL